MAETGFQSNSISNCTPHAATFHMLFAHKTSIQALQFEAWDWSRDSYFLPPVICSQDPPIQALHLKRGIGTETHVSSSLGVACSFLLLFAISSSLLA
jgi:hypothetical protein